MDTRFTFTELRKSTMNQTGILKNKWYLYLTEFFSGMAVMAVELGASRLLAPYFSSSQIVWTIIIGTIMIAMALGNVYGGRKADQDPNPDKLYGRILIAAIWIALIPVLGRYIILGISAVLIFTVSSNFLIIAAFAACMVVFVFPLFLLGTVTPSLVKYTTDSLDDNGKIVGTLGASNTIGSIIGTFVPTFVTIPAVGTAITFLIFSGILIVLSLVYFISTKKKSRLAVASVIILIIASIFGHDASFAFWEKDSLTYEGESVYNYLQVKEDDEKVILSTNVLFGVQSVKMKEQSMTGLYYDYAMAAPLMAGIYDQDEVNILILGNGTGTFATQCEEYFGDRVNLNIDAVVIDDKISELAYEYFDLSPEVNLTTYDGRAYLNAIDDKYDVIMVDAYQDITIPFQMSSTEFFQLVADHLTDDGVMVVNMNMHGDKEGNINEYLSDTIGTAFSTIYTADVKGSTNRELFASNNPDMLTVFQENVDRQAEYAVSDGAANAGSSDSNATDAGSSDSSATDAGSASSALENASYADSTADVQLYLMMDQVDGRLTAYEPGDYIMTDDKAPVELLGMQVIDDLIQDEVAYYKNIYETEGIQGLLDQI